ncbi:hydroxymethylglutaryl-CoA lyase [Cupriavidus plantarum]|uniref:Hydroxymethylglutaryl-CoA lyase n=1 Tax=Cupriavidus plantarum TaxID=942865 RepID=A0A316F026_9BURK|nr:hydroxymethylglutaryl-CoA lyase [Cupriavidus plantarum]NYH99730.1 hydroxymethylglutaryl-CoA lyase [Cupriavidus plantarum]PWK36929.1 hydroxymethylglutaryl-CoA lyase [Cupriavidus plantarum]REF02332.1 hydroxymethylglutaryl-CoA lyase [Cupriavidus plantarum]RLK44813.1 hydroxymethylglutaryl-CoA lyase [Cupriavidus plantarum]CAG2152020.1 Hydroxymethylglutaryl-CoA lyase YngG [Cupriavidus plantarum]
MSANFSHNPYKLAGPARVEINDVAPRDGLQIEPVVVPTHGKVAFVNALSHCGFARIEATSFTSAKAIPALADAEAVMHQIERVPGVRYTVLVPNLRGLERALSCHPDEVNLVMSTSETHNRANLRMTREQSRAQLLAMIAEAGRAGVPVNVSLSTVFGCPFEGEVSVEDVMGFAQTFADAGAAGITLCDTTGMAYPNQVAALCEDFQKRLPDTGLTIHLHNTRGMGLANAMAAWQTGVTRFDAAAGGLGGCPYAPGASGNVSTEELVHMFASMGVETGVDLGALLDVVASLPALVERDISSQLLRAGPRLRTHQPPAWMAEHFQGQ